MTNRSIVHALALVAVLAVNGARGNTQSGVVSEARPQPAVSAIIAALETHALVGIGEMHRNQQVHDLIVTVVRDPRFLPNGGDIVVEFGNARFQSVVDRYVRGEAVTSSQLAQAWRDAVNILVWDAPVYERLYVTVRAVNRGRDAAKRLRIVLADPPFDWSQIHDRAAWERVVVHRDRHAAGVIEREVLSKHRHALLIFGSGHLENEKVFDGSGTPAKPRQPNLAEILNAEHPGATFSRACRLDDG
jgi:uncharacterized iron-regulated protein